MLCSKCGTENENGAVFCMECGTRLNEIQIVEEPSKTEGSTLWKVLSVAGFVFALLFFALYSNQIAKYEDITQEYFDLKEEYAQLKKRYDRYDLEGRYAVEVTEVYNSDEDGKKINDALVADSIDNICVGYTVYDFADNWQDPFYVDIIQPDGSVRNPKPENNNHTLSPDVDRDDPSWRLWWNPNGETGTYKLVFYQGNLAICVHEIDITE